MADKTELMAGFSADETSGEIDSDTLLEMVNETRVECGENRFAIMSLSIALRMNWLGSFTKLL